jgi:hypothetical protein
MIFASNNVAGFVGGQKFLIKGMLVAGVRISVTSAAVVPPAVAPPVIHSGSAVGMGFGGRRLEELNLRKRDVDVVAVIFMAMRY